MGTLRPINPHTASLIANPQATAHDYDNLTHKPQISGVTLSGDKTPDELGLQKKLTAGQNITIGNDGTISASGGVTSYNDLNNKPQIGFTGRRVTLENILNFHFGDFNGEVLPNGVDIGLRENVFKSSLSPTNDILYNFNQIKSNLLYTGVFKIRKVDVTNLPQEFTDAGSTIYVYHYVTTKTYSDLIRMVTYDTDDGVKMWIQLVALGGMDASDNVQVTAQTDWVELTGGGSQIVSGVVNANGTITFTDSDGNTFTTTGLSVIGADGVGIADVHIDGGGDLIIEDTTGHMENVGHVVGADGQDYVLTSQDKTDIANIVLGELPTTEGVLYGN